MEVFKKLLVIMQKVEAYTGNAMGNSGFKVYGVGAVTVVKHTSIVVQEDTVFSVFKINGVDKLSERGMTGYTFGKGSLLPGGQGYITDFTIDSGSVIAY